MRARPRPLLLLTVAAVCSIPAASASAAPSPVGVVHAAQPGGTVQTWLDPRTPAPGPLVQDGQPFVVRCQVNGEKLKAINGVSRLWNQIQLATGQVVYLPGAATELSTRSELVAPYCGWAEATRVGGTQGLCFRRSPIALIRAPKSRGAFVRKVAPEARRSFRATGVPASVTLAQAILESKDGTATAGANNYFGIKAQQVDPGTGTFSWTSTAIGCVNTPTFEREGGADVRVIAAFRLYRTTHGSFVDHGRFLRDNPRYAGAFRYRRSPQRFAKALQRAGYATDPSYSATLIALIKEGRLTRYDR